MIDVMRLQCHQRILILVSVVNGHVEVSHVPNHVLLVVIHRVDVHQFAALNPRPFRLRIDRKVGRRRFGHRVDEVGIAQGFVRFTRRLPQRQRVLHH